MCLLSWVNASRKKSERPIIALDGKTLRGSYRNDCNQALHSVSAFDVEQGLMLYQEMSDGKGCEIEAVRNILNVLDITDSVITLDALHCQRETLTTLIGVVLIMLSK